MRVFDEKLSVRDIEKLIKSLKTPKKDVSNKKTVDHSIFYKDIEEKMQTIIGTKVAVNAKGNGKGKIEIEYYSNEELQVKER